MMGLLDQCGERMILDDFYGNNIRKSYILSEIELEDDIIELLISFHAFVAHGFASSFLRML